jgi:hypothetical protein
MAKESYKNKEAAVKAQEAQKEVVVTAKAALTSYLKKNKLERDKDYSKDKKHGKALKTLNLEIEKANEKLVEINKITDSFKAEKAGKGSKDKAAAKDSSSKGAKTTHTYPEGLTSAEKKKWRVAARKGVTDAKELLKAAKADKVEKVKKEKAPKEEVKSEKVKDTKKSKTKETPKEEKSSKKDKKAKAKKGKSSKND